MTKTLDNFKIVTKAGATYDMAADFNVLVRSFSVSSPRPEFVTDEIDGRHGKVRMGKTWGSRKLTAVCALFAADSYDVALLRNDVFKALMTLDEFYLICDAEPGKRWKVEVANEWTPDRIGRYGEFTVEFVSHGPFAESVGTTLDEKTFDAEKWQLGQGLIQADDMMYVHTATSFRIFNAGDETIDPRELPLKITYKGASTNLVIKNVTTAETWSYEGTSNSGDNIVLDGIRSTKNGLSIFAKTNRKLISMKPGWNDFTLEGTSGAFEITFDFRFYYL